MLDTVKAAEDKRPDLAAALVRHAAGPGGPHARKMDKKLAAGILMNMKSKKAGAIWGYISVASGPPRSPGDHRHPEPVRTGAGGNHLDLSQSLRPTRSKENGIGDVRQSRPFSYTRYPLSFQNTPENPVY